MKCKTEVLQDVISFDVNNSVGSLLGYDRQIYSTGMNLATKIVDIMGLNTINTHCNFLSGVKDNGNYGERLAHSVTKHPNVLF